LQNIATLKKNFLTHYLKKLLRLLLENGFEGLLLKINNQEVWSKLIGNFNAYNLTAVFACAELMGLETLETLQLISNLENVDGRFEYTVSENKVTAVVDFAHTPDALKNVLETINAIRTRNENVITVVGCGGDRDKDKRPKMGAIAAQLSDQVIFTSDNPRSEKPEDILLAIENGVEPLHFKKTLTIVDREQAIKTAVKMAKPKDIILIAGKGHENYQEINGVKTPFNDFEIVNNYLKLLS